MKESAIPVLYWDHRGIKLSLLLNAGLELAVSSSQCDSFLLKWLFFVLKCA